MDHRTVTSLCVGNIETNCWIYTLESSDSAAVFCAVIDPGAEPEIIIDYLKKQNLSADCILMTHGHYDHVTALPQLMAAFPRAIAAIHQNDMSFVNISGIRQLSDGEVIGPFLVMNVKGHTKGSVAFFDAEGDILFTGDTLFCADCGRTDLPGGSQAELEASLRKLLAMKGDIRVLPGHGPESTIADEAARGIGFFID